MREMHAVDINCIVSELKNLPGARVDKIYQDSRDVMRIRFYGGSQGRAELLIEAGRRIHLTQFRRKAPKTPTSFAMFLRKHLGNKALTDVSQSDFDRVVILEFHPLRLVVELFSRGNIVLLSADGEVMLSMKKGGHGRVEKGSSYSLPEPPGSPFGLSGVSELRERLGREDIVRSLAVDLGLGRLYANEACISIDIDKHASPERITDEQAERLLAWLDRLEEVIADPEQPVIYRDERPVEYAPFKLDSMEKEPETSESFNQAADLYYSAEERSEIRQEAEEVKRERLQKLEKRLHIQTTQLSHLTDTSDKLREGADMLFAHYTQIQHILTGLSDVQPDLDTFERLASQVQLDAQFRAYDPRTDTITFLLDDSKISLDLGKSLEENAGKLYTKAKDLETKAEGAEKSIALTRMEMKRAQRLEIPAQGAPQSKDRKREWYEKFRWFVSSNDFLVIAGRDAKSNEILVRRHLERDDLYAHADIQGAPSTIIKTEGRDVTDATLLEACAFAVIHSSIWKSGTTAADVYWVNSDQVTKQPTSGEFVAKGAFVIRGERNYFHNLEARCGVGWYDGRFMCGPLEAVAEHCEGYLEITPGYRKKSDVAKEIMQRLDGEKRNADLDQLIQVLPPGQLAIRS